MQVPYSITVQYSPHKCGWTCICYDDADNYVGIRYFGQMDKAITFANRQCHQFIDADLDVALTVYDRKGDRSYSVAPDAFRRAAGIEWDRQVRKDFPGGSITLRTTH